MIGEYFFTKKPHLLDVGCGKGFFVKEARDNDIVAQGIDLSESGISHAVDILGVPARVGKMEDQTDGDWKEKFDVITFWATIEHLPDPHLTLDAIYKCLKPNGIVIMDTGLGNHHLEKFLPGYNQWYIAPEHLFVFSEIGLVSLVRKAGFKVIFVNENFERSYFRKIIRAFRHDLICLAAGLLLGPLLGKRSRFKMKREAKWAIGNLITVVCQK